MSHHLTAFSLVRHVVCFDPVPEFMNRSSVIFLKSWDEYVRRWCGLLTSALDTVPLAHRTSKALLRIGRNREDEKERRRHDFSLRNMFG